MLLLLLLLLLLQLLLLLAPRGSEAAADHMSSVPTAAHARRASIASKTGQQAGHRHPYCPAVALVRQPAGLCCEG